MNILPDWIVAIDENLSRVKRYDRIDPESELGKRLKESDYDRMIVSQVDLLADTLRQAEVIADDSDLIVLGTQVKAIDVLLAEVEAETGEFRRLVLVEDKLFVNPEARRDVLAQILEYVHNIESLIHIEDWTDMLPDHRSWIEEDWDGIKSTMRTGDYLLLICGDRIHTRLLDLVDRFVKRADNNPLNLTELCLVSMAIYSDGANYLLIPNVVGAVIGVKRELTIRVQVQDAEGKPIKATSEIVTDVSGGDHPGEEDFFKKYWKSNQEIADCQAILNALEYSGIRGLRRTHADNGRPMIDLEETPFGKINILRVSSLHPTLRDNLQKYAGNPQLTDAVTDLRYALLKIPGATKPPDKPYVRVPVNSPTENSKYLIEAIEKFATALRKPND